MTTLGCGPHTGASNSAGESLAGASIHDVGAGAVALATVSGGGSAAADPTSTVRASTVRELLSSRASVGRRVLVTGRCLGPASAGALGPAPRGLDAWQLEADGVAIYVAGPRPDECLTTGDTTQTTITAVVAEDTLPPLGDLPAAPRRYLVRVGPQPGSPAPP